MPFSASKQNALPTFRNAISVMNTGKAKHSMPPTVAADITTEESTIADNLVAFGLGHDDDAESTSEFGGVLVELQPDSDMVVRRGRIFRSGEYPDKKFSLTPKELKQVVKEFSGPIQLDSEHERSIFDGKLGQLIAVESNEDGTELHGSVAIPKWLDPILMQAGGKVSAAFDRVSKKLVGLALTISPRVPDAVLMAAFSIDQATRGSVSVEDLIKMAAKNDKKLAKKIDKAKSKSDQKTSKNPFADKDAVDKDAGDKKKKKIKKFVGYDGMVPQAGQLGQNAGANNSQKDSVLMASTKSGLGMMQAIHDTTAARGAVCRIETQNATTVGPYGIVRYASKAEMSVVQAIHDTTLQSGASCVATLYGQQDLPDGTPWSWKYPGINAEGTNTMPGSAKSPHFSEENQGSQKAMKKFAKFMQSLDNVDPRYAPTATKAGAAVATRTASADASSDDRRSLDEENARLREDNRQMRMQGILDRAVGFAEKMVVEGHATPIERDGIVTVHAQLEHDDTFSAKATFSNGMSRVSAYEASILARPNNLLAAELLPASVQAGLIKFANLSETPKSNTSEYGKMSDERKRQLTNLDPVLKKAYADTTGRGN